jgi:hypothetical protein
MVNVNGFRLAVPGDTLTEAMFEDVKVSATIDTQVAGSVDEALVKVFNAVYEAAGEIRR